MLAAYVSLLVVANVGAVTAPKLQTSNPALMLAMSARNRHLLVAVTNHIGAVPYAVVGFGRMMLSAAVCYGLGMVFGDRTLRWLRRYLGVPQTSIDQMERGFETASWALVPFFAGSNIVAMLAGLRPLPFKRFMALVAAGSAARLVLFWFLAERLRSPLQTFVTYSTRYQWPLMAALLGWVVFSNVRNFRRGRNA
jgi:membrane protein DedA with SNARE-associated domain